MIVLELSVDDESADWIKYVVDPTTGKTSRQSQLELHERLAGKRGKKLTNVDSRKRVLP